MVDRNSRLWWLIPPVGILLGVGLAVWLRTSPVSRASIDFAKLTDTQGRRGNPTDFAGHYLLVAFGYTSCPDVCPMTLHAVSAALEQLGASGRDLKPVFISIDPERDSPARLEAYVGAFGPEIRGFTGSPPQIAATAAAFHVEYRREPQSAQGQYAVDHTALLFLVDPTHRVIATLPESLPLKELQARIVQKYRTARAG